LAHASDAQAEEWKRLRPGRLALLLLAAALTLAALRVALWQPLPLTGQAPEDGYVRVPGVVHVHTTFSDGGGTPDEVIRAARAAGARFVVITDHNNVDAMPFEGYREGVLVLVGSELSTTAGHILGLGIVEPTYRFSGDGLDGLEDIRDLGGFAFAAHPLSPRDDLRFTGWDLPGPWGLELVNGDSEWRQAGPRILLTVGLYGLNHRYALLRLLNPPDPTLARWDALLAERDVVGLAGADAHSRLPLTKTRALRFPSYESLFGLLVNHVLLKAPLTGRFEADREAVLDALRHGRTYVGLDALAPADGFSFTAEVPGRRVTMGETVPPLAGLRLKAGGRLPENARLVFLRDGKRLAEGRNALEADVPGPGVYRAQVHVEGASVPWVLGNPIYVFDDAARAQRSRRAAWPVPPEPPSPALVLDDFEGKTAFAPGADSFSSVRKDILDARGGVDGRRAARLEFRIGEPKADHPHVFAALVDWTHRDLGGHSGLVFSIRADGVYRIWVQVRDENPASADDGTEWWFASVRTSTEWQRITLPFSRLRSINPKSDGRLDLDKVRALVFVLDRGAVKPGTRGTIWLDDLGVY
jgi:hypothetical protein